jgi:hypothetical protein
VSPCWVNLVGNTLYYLCGYPRWTNLITVEARSENDANISSWFVVSLHNIVLWDMTLATNQLSLNIKKKFQDLRFCSKRLQIIYMHTITIKASWKDVIGDGWCQLYDYLAYKYENLNIQVEAWCTGQFLSNSNGITHLFEDWCCYRNSQASYLSCSLLMFMSVTCSSWSILFATS